MKAGRGDRRVIGQTEVDHPVAEWSLFSRIMAALMSLLGLSLLAFLLSGLGSGMRVQSSLAVYGAALWMLVLGLIWIMVVKDWPRRSWAWLKRAFLL